MIELVRKVLITALCFPRFIFSAVHFEFLKISNSNPLGTFFHTLALATRPGEEQDDGSKYTLISTEQKVAEQEIRKIFDSQQVIARSNNQNLHVTLREAIGDESSNEDRWEKLRRVLENQKGVAFKTKIRELDKFFNLYEFVFPCEASSAEQMILCLPDYETDITSSLLFLASCSALVFAYCLGGFSLLLAAVAIIYGIYSHLHDIIRVFPLLKDRLFIIVSLLIFLVSATTCWKQDDIRLASHEICLSSVKIIHWFSSLQSM